MPRYPRSFIKTSFFHVIVQGIERKFIFDKPEDIKYYIKNMYQLKRQYPMNIISYCIMSNHAHILIEVKNIGTLSKYMQRLNTKYGKYYNDKYERVGYVFRDRYKAEGIYSEQHLYNCMKYIYDNPVKAGICKIPKDYPYSNYKEINKDLEEGYLFLDIDEDNEIMCKNAIKQYMTENNLELESLKEDSEKTKELIVLLKEKYNISLRRIARELNLTREKTRRIYLK